MSEVKHTPGPWKIAQTEPPGDFVIHAKGIPWQLAYVPASTQIEWPLEANARLIAAAPDLLSALKVAQAALAMMIEPNSISKTTLPVAFAEATEAEAIARGAIAKAVSP